MCVAVGDGISESLAAAPALYISRNGGHTWSSPASPVTNLALSAVSCPTTSECIAVGGSTGGSTSPGDVIVTFDGGRHWAVQTVPHVAANVGFDMVECVGTRHCIVLGGGQVAEFAISN
jgi:photosystem II stability/assembly factor-like uncharacterized protein